MPINCLSFVVILAILFLPIFAVSQNLSGISICIDPGHGPGNVNAGPTGLREADINFRVALSLKNYLKAAQVDTVLLTHYNNATDISLSAREQIANNFGVTWFHSVHHNAYNGTSRYTLLLLEEKRTSAQLCPDGSRRGTGQAEWPGQSDVMSNIMARRLWEGYRTSTYYSYLDWTFYGGCNGGFSLGVLNDLQMPGELSEATFHDHPGEEAKMRNNDFLRMEARALAMSFFDYFKAGTMPTGALIGIVSDAETGTPLNGIKVTLNPGNLTYTTDNWKNGLYIFDGLAPGDYTVSTEVAGFGSFSQTAKITAHAFSYGDARLIPSSPPTVASVAPRADSIGVYVYDPIRISFSRAMNPTSVQTAFRIEPKIAGTLRSESNNKTFVFEPDFRFEFGTTYTITIDSSAQDIFGHTIDGNRDGRGGDAFSSHFTTIPLNIAVPVVVNYTPRKKQTGVFLREVIELWLNRPIDLATVGQQSVSVIAPGNRRANLRIFASTENGLQKFSLVPVQNLVTSAIYTATLFKSIKDVNGTPMPNDFIWQFKTSASSEVWETISTFSEIDQPFSDPLQNPRTSGIVRDSTQYSLTRAMTISDSTAGHLRYQFTSLNKKAGAVFFELRTPRQLDSTDTIALFVFGDGSGNKLQWHLRTRDGALALYEKSLDFTNWRNLRLEVRRDSLLVTGNKLAAASLAPLRWEGLALENNQSLSGEIYFDDLLHIHPQRTAVAEPVSSGTKSFMLAQNFPNPFNPETEISYAVPQRAHVKIAIFDQLGRLVRVLVDDVLAAGEYRVRWDGRDGNAVAVTSGIYFMKMTSESFSAVRKLVLMR
ncbi:MAG: Ig-like domain-containing protein [candidate division KSB1 bacterium]|nr:Ig-like domain-containing protein [candidate division KSB1 bacterium]MDZ7303886.1 Ig-like domain-containing protein [candidate division KSB1 bacterium]MDZ7313190.1 Ig-like domain-containing protein [candidate division KSB1 bacterium]